MLLEDGLLSAQKEIRRLHSVCRELENEIIELQQKNRYLEEIGKVLSSEITKKKRWEVNCIKIPVFIEFLGVI